MLSKKDYKPMIFTDGVDVSIGRGYVEQGWLYFVSIGGWGEPKKTYKIPTDLLSYYYSNCKFYDPHKKDSNADEWQIYYFSLQTFLEFNYKESTPAQISHENNMLKNKLSVVESEREELLAILRADSIHDARKRMVSDFNKWAKDNMSYGGGAMTNPGAVNKGEGK